MAIQILPPQLANQIAAGEVVERPASVVKELIENSIDAGATRIDVEIERGGSKRILIRDNGKGIAKDELALALARHATSKVATLDDLESILSFGFRGEALASISSVARLTLSSRTPEASEAWQAYAEGHDMAVKVQPAAHPVGTTVEAVDLFFNTPARRRFLKADKTEFTHIEEQLRRIALARDDIHLVLRHNGKLIRQYRPATNERQRDQRLGSICGSAFLERAFSLTSATDDLSLRGYIALDDDKAKVSDIQYFYVNGRVVRDRLVNHAVRQALEESGYASLAGFVLYLNLDPQEVDVNVHPAKHEVRFHQSRLVHDFILQALQEALTQQQQSLFHDAQVQEPVPTYRISEDGEVLDLTGSGAATPTLSTERGTGNDPESTSSAAQPASNYKPQDHRDADSNRASYAGVATARVSDQRSTAQRDTVQRATNAGYQPPPLRSTSSSRAAAENYGRLLQPSHLQATHDETTENNSTWQWLSLLNEQFALVQSQQQLRVVDLHALSRALNKQAIIERLPQGLVAQPLLLPVSLAADPNWHDLLSEQEELLRRLGIQLVLQNGRLVIRTVPALLRRADLVQVIPDLLQWLQGEQPDHPALAHWLVSQSQEWVEPNALWQQWLHLVETQAEPLLEHCSQELAWQHILESNS